MFLALAERGSAAHARWVRWLVAVVSFGCASGVAEPRSLAPQGTAGEATPQTAPTKSEAPGSLDSPGWAAQASSPRWHQVEPRLKRLVGDCPIDGALVEVAGELAQGRLEGNPPPEMDEISFALRRSGSPYVWPRAWALLGSEIPHEDATDRVHRWMATFGDGGSRRCGVAWLSDASGNQAVAVVAVDAVADLSSMPTRARAGQWASLDAKLLVPASEAKVVLLGPRGTPRVVSATLRGSDVNARFLLDRAGEWTVQLLPTTASGPRPAIEVSVFVDEDPPRGYREKEVPGESAAQGFTPSKAGDYDVGVVESATFAMLNAARRLEGAGTLVRDLRLDELAREHAAAMLAAGRVGHDLGRGGPLARLQQRGLASAINGENLAHATTARRAHRALWASPSHRGNMLDSRFSRVGVGAARGPDGSVWLCQIFAG